MNIMENATKHFEDKVKNGLNEVDVPEWGCKVSFLPVMTVREMEALYSHMEKGNQLDALVEMLILRARNEDGSMAFKKGDKFEIMNKMDPEVVIRVASEVIESGTSVQTDTLAKN